MKKGTEMASNHQTVPDEPQRCQRVARKVVFWPVLALLALPVFPYDLRC